jgi:SAM-dependent methyltransferase
MIGHIRELTGLLPQSVRFTLRRFAFSGSRFRCPTCGSGIRRWLGHGGGPEVLERRKVVGGRLREDDRCPICHAKDRTRLIQLYLETEAGAGRRPLRVLDFAPEFGLYLWLGRQPGVDYTAVDIDRRRYRHIANFVEADITRLPFADGAFDVIICSHVLEHVPDDARAMAELRRCLAPGGRALLLVPEATDDAPTDEDLAENDPGERERRFGQWDHVRLYARDDFVARLRRAGFEVQAFNPGRDDAAARDARRLNPDELLRVCSAAA